MPASTLKKWDFLNYQQPARRQVRDFYSNLERELVPFDSRLVKEQAKAVAHAWLLMTYSSAEAAEVAQKRRLGTGRRPRQSQVSGAMKRGGLQFTQYQQALERLEKMVGRSAGAPPKKTLAEELSGL